MKRQFISLLLILLFAGVSQTWAQPWSGFGIRAGGTSALFRGDNVGITDDATDRHLGFTVGVYKAIPIGAGFELQPEVRYTQKGGKLDNLEDDAMGAFDVNFSVDYIEVPVVLAYVIPTGSRWVPIISAGPYVSLATRRNATFDFDEGDLSINGDETFKQLDYGVAFGADLGFKLRRHVASVGVRYDLGVADIVKDDPSDPTVTATDARTDELSLVIGFRL